MTQVKPKVATPTTGGSGTNTQTSTPASTKDKSIHETKSPNGKTDKVGQKAPTFQQIMAEFLKILASNGEKAGEKQKKGDVADSGATEKIGKDIPKTANNENSKNTKTDNQNQKGPNIPQKILKQIANALNTTVEIIKKVLARGPSKKDQKQANATAGG